MYYDNRGIVYFHLYSGTGESTAPILNWCFTIMWTSAIMWNGNRYLLNSLENLGDGVCCTELFQFMTSKAICFLSMFFSGIKTQHLFKVNLQEGRLLKTRRGISLVAFLFCLSFLSFFFFNKLSVFWKIFLLSSELWWSALPSDMYQLLWFSSSC